MSRWEVATTLIGDALREALGSEPNATVERHPEHRCAPIVLVDLDDCSVAAPVLARHYPALLYCMAGELWVTSTREDADSPLRLGRVEDLLDELPQGASADIFLEFGEHRYRWRDPNFSRKPDSWARGGAVPLGSPRCRTVAYESSEGAVLGLMGDKGYASPDNVLPASWLDTCVGLDDYLS